MRIRSPDRLLGFPSGFPLGMVPSKNLDERNSLFPYDSVLTIQNSLRKIGIIWSFSLLEKFKRGKILCEDGLTIVGNFENLAKLCERKSDEFVLNHKRDEDVTGFFSLKSDLSVKVKNEARDNWLINFVEAIETNIGKTMINVMRCVVKLINNSTLMNTLIFDSSSRGRGKCEIECLVMDLAEKECLAILSGRPP
nr:hypothetical protein [Tanacetum cinerariifolium]